MNSLEIEQHIEAVLRAIGEDPNREGLKETPKRVACSYKKLFSGYDQNPADVVTVFDNEGYDEMVIARDIEFYSFCEHHMIPFFGRAHIGYIPNDKIIGVSKMPRILEIFARRLQNQERLTSQVANSLMELLKPKGVGVVLEAKHLCMMARGVEKQNSMMVTSTVRGLFKKNLNTRTEFLRLIGKV